MTTQPKRVRISVGYDDSPENRALAWPWAVEQIGQDGSLYVVGSSRSKSKRAAYHDAELFALGCGYEIVRDAKPERVQ